MGQCQRIVVKTLVPMGAVEIGRSCSRNIRDQNQILRKTSFTRMMSARSVGRLELVIASM